MSNHNCSNGTVKILARAQTFTSRLFKSVPVASRYCVALQMHLNMLTRRLLPFWMISGAICLCFDWGWAHVSQRNVGQKKEREKEPVPEFTSCSCKDIVGLCVVEAEERWRRDEFFCHWILWGIFTQVPARCGLGRLLAAVGSPQWYCNGACKCKRNNSSVGGKKRQQFWFASRWN